MSKFKVGDLVYDTNMNLVEKILKMGKNSFQVQLIKNNDNPKFKIGDIYFVNSLVIANYVKYPIFDYNQYWAELNES